MDETLKRKESRVKTGKSKKISPEARYRMVQEAAYLIAEKDGFQGDATAYWLKAESEVETRLSKKAKK